MEAGHYIPNDVSINVFDKVDLDDPKKDLKTVKSGGKRSPQSLPSLRQKITFLANETIRVQVQKFFY